MSFAHARRGPDEKQRGKGVGINCRHHVCVDFGWIRKGPKLADFEQKAPRGFRKMADFGEYRKSLQTPWNASYMLANGFLTAC